MPLDTSSPSETPQAPDAARTPGADIADPRPGRPTAHEARQRLAHLLSTQAEAIQRVLKEINEAFARIDDGSYGACLGCSKPVPAERLEILPYTRYCVPCQCRAAT